MRTSSHLKTAAAILAAALGTHAHAASETDAVIAELRAKIAELDQKLRILERKEELQDEAADARAKTAPVVTAGEGGFRIASPDKAYELRIRANVQADARFFLDDSGQTNDTFLLRRVRPSFEGTLANRIGFRIMPDFAPSTTTLLDAYLNYKFSDAFVLQAGKFKVPFDLERLVSQTDLLFVERGFPTSLGPNRDLGIQVSGTLFGGKLDYQAGVFNGVVDNGSSVTDGDDNKELAARVFAHPFLGSDGPLAGLGVGLAVTAGELRATAPSSYRTNAQQTFFSYRTGVVHDGTHTRVSPQLYYYSGPLGLLASYTVVDQDVRLNSTTSSLTNTAWSVNASWVLTGEDASYRGVRPRDAFDPGAGKWGALEVAARYGVTEIDDDTFPTFANLATSASKANAATLGLNWYLNRHLKAVANYEYTTFEGGGTGTVTRTDEHAILTRFQVSY